jgi:hypothetical protein
MDVPNAVSSNFGIPKQKRSNLPMWSAGTLIFRHVIAVTILIGMRMCLNASS